MTAVMPTYFNQLPVTLERGHGVWVWDTENKQYLDALAGIAVTALGHAHPAVTKTITEQAGKLIHTSNTYHIAHQEKLAEKLTQLAGMDQVFFCNSGAEANEAALKLTRMVARKKQIANPIVITLMHSFHGRTLATLSASGNERIQIGFEPLVPGFIHVAMNDITAIRNVLQNNSNVVAIMLEPIQGDGGIRLPNEDYLSDIRTICDEYDLLMILDEVQTGLGRTGEWFAFQHSKITPDVMTLAKALANGIPIGACLARGKACNLFPPGKHGTTFGGNPLACATALTVLDSIERQQLLSNAHNMGERLLTGLKKALHDHPKVVEIRGKGLIIGVELTKPALEMTRLGLKHGLLFNVTANTVIRLLPPLIINADEVDQIIVRLTRCLNE